MTTDVTTTVTTYFEGFLGAEAELLAAAFHADAVLLSAGEGGLVDRTALSEWLPRVRERRRQGAPRTGRARIVSVDVAGDAASVKAEIDFPTHRFVDYLSLLKLNGTWKIVHKIYTTETV